MNIKSNLRKAFPGTGWKYRVMFQLRDNCLDEDWHNIGAYFSEFSEAGV